MKAEQSIGYCGFAKIKKMRGKKVVEEHIFHNSGTNYLFQALASTLCGQNRTSDMPQYFDLGLTDDNNTYTVFLSSRSPLTSRLVRDYKITGDTSAAVAAVFTAYIPSRTIVNTTNNINTLALYSTYSFGDNTSTRLAQIDLTGDEVFKLSDNSTHSYIVEWVMTFSNVVTVAQTNQEV